MSTTIVLFTPSAYSPLLHSYAWNLGKILNLSLTPTSRTLLSQNLPNSSSSPTLGKPHHPCMDYYSCNLVPGLLVPRSICALQERGSFLKPRANSKTSSSLWLSLYSFLTVSPHPCPLGVYLPVGLTGTISACCLAPADVPQKPQNPHPHHAVSPWLPSG